MFFCIAHTVRPNFPEQHYAGSFVINLDPGWCVQQVGDCTVVYKGYADAVNLSKSLDTVIAQREPAYTGNYCALCYNPNTKTITVHSSADRSFPIFVKPGEVTNLVPGGRTVWADGLIVIKWDMSVEQIEFDAIGKISTDLLSADQVVQAVTEILDQRCQQFLINNQLPIKSYLSGGVDSLLVYSFLKKHGADVELVNYEHVDYDWFWTQNSGDIRHNWGYKQIHHWREPCVVSSGAPGDEFMLRSPDTANQYLLYHHTSILEQIELYPNSLHARYFNLPKHHALFKNHQVDQSTDRSVLFWRLCNTVVNDWQHWHIGNTLTWTPLRDLDIFKLLLRLELPAAIDQIIKSSLSISIIERNCPGLSQAISDYKNTGNILSNLGRYFTQHNS